MVGRQWLGDVSLAVLLALPLAVLARPDAVPHKQVASTHIGTAPANSPLAHHERVSVLD